MFCPKCGNEVAENAEFCIKCGTKIQNQDTTPQEGISNQQLASQTENVQQPINKQSVKKRKLERLEKTGKIIMVVTGVVMFISSFIRLPISSIFLGLVMAVGLILSSLNLGRPIKLSKLWYLFVGIFIIVIFFVASAGKSEDKYVKMVKNGTFDAYPQVTVGKAFDNFIGNAKWESGLSEDHVRFVNVTGDIIAYGKEAKVCIQFVIEDEKTGRFSYNACEINDIPQNDFFFWGLLEAIYSDSGLTADQNSLSQLGSTESRGKIAVNETWNANYSDKNLKITLDSVEFRSDTFGMGLFASKPDEGFVWLVATVTVENVGTKETNFPLDGKLVYDGQYEYKSDSRFEGDSFSMIAPLSAPKTQSLAFMVPEILETSEKPLVLYIQDLYNSDGFSGSYVIRQGDGILSGTGTGGNISENKGTYEGLWEDAYSQRASMEIVRDESTTDSYFITISWSSSATDGSTWYLYGDYEDGGIHYFGDREDTKYSVEANDTFYYTYDGAEEGFVWIAEDGKLYWKDYVGGAGDYCEFVRVLY